MFWWFFSVSRSWFGDECWSCAVNWSLLFMAISHGISFLWISMIFPIPAWFWANTRGSIQMRRTRTTTTSRYRLATDVSLEFFSATVCSGAKFPGALSQEYDPLELEELWEGCFLVVALEGWVKQVIQCESDVRKELNRPRRIRRCLLQTCLQLKPWRWSHFDGELDF